MTDVPYNAADPNSVKQRKRTDKERLEQQQKDLNTLLQLPEFRRYVWRHIGATCRLLESPGSNNGSIQSHNIGMQDVARLLWAEIEKVDALAIPRMMTEHHEAQG